MKRERERKLNENTDLFLFFPRSLCIQQKKMWYFVLINRSNYTAAFLSFLNFTTFFYYPPVPSSSSLASNNNLITITTTTTLFSVYY